MSIFIPSSNNTSINSLSIIHKKRSWKQSLDLNFNHKWKSFTKRTSLFKMHLNPTWIEMCKLKEMLKKNKSRLSHSPPKLQNKMLVRWSKRLSLNNMRKVKTKRELLIIGKDQMKLISEGINYSTNTNLIQSQFFQSIKELKDKIWKLILELLKRKKIRKVVLAQEENITSPKILIMTN